MTVSSSCPSRQSRGFWFRRPQMDSRGVNFVRSRRRLRTDPGLCFRAYWGCAKNLAIASVRCCFLDNMAPVAWPLHPPSPLSVPPLLHLTAPFDLHISLAIGSSAASVRRLHRPRTSLHARCITCAFSDTTGLAHRSAVVLDGRTFVLQPAFHHLSLFLHLLDANVEIISPHWRFSPFTYNIWRHVPHRWGVPQGVVP